MLILLRLWLAKLVCSANNKEAGRNARPQNSLVGPPGFEPRTQGL